MINTLKAWLRTWRERRNTTGTERLKAQKAVRIRTAEGTVAPTHVRRSAAAVLRARHGETTPQEERPESVNGEFHDAVVAAVAATSDHPKSPWRGAAVTGWVLAVETYNPTTGEYLRRYLVGPHTSPWTAESLADHVAEALYESTGTDASEMLWETDDDD